VRRGGVVRTATDIRVEEREAPRCPSCVTVDVCIEEICAAAALSRYYRPGEGERLPSSLLLP
jgi:hypothetical protein